MVQLLSALPDTYAVTPIGPARFVVGPTGTHLVLGQDASAPAARSLVRLAATIRSVLAEHLAWVPFVHVLVVSEHVPVTPQVTVVPPDLLLDLLTSGRAALEEETRARIGHLVATGVLTGLEAVGPAPADAKMAGAKMTGCTELTAPTASTSPSTISGPTATGSPPSSPTPPASTVGSGSRSHGG